MKICARCDMPLKDADAEPYDVASPSAAGTTIYIHRDGCTRSGQQTAPSTAWR